VVAQNAVAIFANLVTMRDTTQRLRDDMLIRQDYIILPANDASTSVRSKIHK
jgi:hypothetical protein